MGPHSPDHPCCLQVIQFPDNLKFCIHGEMDVCGNNILLLMRCTVGHRIAAVDADLERSFNDLTVSLAGEKQVHRRVLRR